MRYFITPHNFETMQENLLVIGYYHGKAIVRDECRTLFFVRCEEGEAPIGTIASREVLMPLEMLNTEEQEQIRRIYET